MAVKSKKGSLPKDILASLRLIEKDLKDTIRETNEILDVFKKEIVMSFKDPKRKTDLLKNTFFWESRNKILSMKINCLNSYNGVLLKRGEAEGSDDESIDEGETLKDFID